MAPALSQTVEKVVRFGIVGIVNSSLYAVVTAVCADLLEISPTSSSIIGYVAVLPFAFVAHKWFTFRSSADARAEAPRFIIAYVTGLVVAIATMYVATEVFRMSYIVGIIGAVVLVPLLTLLVLEHWVFVRSEH